MGGQLVGEQWAPEVCAVSHVARVSAGRHAPSQAA